MILDLALLALALLIALPLLVFAAECLASLPRPRRAGPGPDAPSPPLAVVIPAHNEQDSVGATVRAIRAQLTESDRLVVVADNCTDATADRARLAGAEVTERFDPQNRGKGFALAHGLEQVLPHHPNVVLFFDADTPPEPGCIQILASWAHRTGRPVQACYLLSPPPDASPRDRISALAFLFKNQVRLLGLRRLGGASHLVGTGMAFPTPLLSADRLASGHLTEDMELGLSLAGAGFAPLFLEEARVLGSLPSQSRVAKTQRTRWEHGHLKLLLSRGPWLLARGLAAGSWRAVALALDLLVPPLSLLFLLATAALLLFGLAAALGPGRPAFGVIVGSTLLALLAFLIAWVRYGRQVVPAAVLVRVPLYILWKVPLYARFLFRPEKQWIRTERGPVAGPEPSERPADSPHQSVV